MAKGFFARFRRTALPGALDQPAVAAEERGLAPVADIARTIARQGLPAAPRKAAISLRLDADVLEWFRAQGPGYQTRINAVLRAYREAAG